MTLDSVPDHSYGPDLAFAIEAVQRFAATERNLTYETARLAIEIGQIDLKLAMARAMYDHAEAAAAWVKRANELAADITDLGPSSRTVIPSRIDAVGGYVATLERLAREYREHLRLAHPISDEPSVRLISARMLVLEEVTDRIRAARGMAADENQINITDDLCVAGYCPPTHPSRDRIFTGGHSPINPLDPNLSLAESALELLHANLTDLELSTIEICSLFILQNRSMPWEFVTDMARQAWDEARHATAFMVRIKELGGTLGARETQFTHWEIVQGLPLPLALCCHQMIGEWIGIDGALWFGAYFRQHGDPETGRIFDFVARDECTHVAFGTKWIERLVPDSERNMVRIAAEDVRRIHNKTVDGPLAFPPNLWACEKGGYSKEDTHRIIDRYELFGSVFGRGPK
jgi:uncharacterized ferritin-like protein (DUF455 family)